jgi:hypothetical protein
MPCCSYLYKNTKPVACSTSARALRNSKGGAQQQGALAFYASGFMAAVATTKVELQAKDTNYKSCYESRIKLRNWN